MKRTLFLLLFITISFNSIASHEITYYVYHEVSYPQGPWAKTDILEKSGYNYLAAEKHEDMMGTTEEELVDKILSRLKDQKPESYDWSRNIAFEEDTVVITTDGPIADFEMVANEVTASLIFNGFTAVEFKQSEESKILTLDDVSLPYLDLVSPATQPQTKTIDKKENPDREETVSENEGSPWSSWLIISVLVNLGLFLLLIFRKRK